jgi:hypothetical protein
MILGFEILPNNPSSHQAENQLISTPLSVPNHDHRTPKECEVCHRYAFHAGIDPLPSNSSLTHSNLDRGGTFTDVWASVPGQEDIILKLLSVDPENYDDAPSEGIRRVLEMVSGQRISRGSQLPKDLIHSIRMGTTVATNGELPGL